MSTSKYKKKKDGVPPGDQDDGPKRKKKDSVPTVERNLRKKKAAVPTLYVHTFCAPFTFEAYIFETSPGNDGYMNSYKEIMKGNKRCKYLTNCLFSSYVFRRGDGDEILGNVKDGYWRIIMIRYPSRKGSTAETREEGLHALRQFFSDKEFNKYPPRFIETEDLSNKENPPALDEFFLDRDIKDFMEEDVDASELNEGFYSKHKAFARKCWSRKPPSEW
jgi:hypothetical protein